MIMLPHDNRNRCKQSKLNPLENILLNLAPMRQMAAKGQSDKMVSDIGVHMKQKGGTEFPRVEKVAPTENH